MLLRRGPRRWLDLSRSLSEHPDDVMRELLLLERRGNVRHAGDDWIAERSKYEREERDDSPAIGDCCLVLDYREPWRSVR